MRNLAAFLIPSALLIAVVLLAQSARAATINAAQEINRATIFALADRNAEAIETLTALSSRSLTKEDQSRAALTLGRIYYQMGKYDLAVTQYDKVSKDSSQWLNAQEEKAWSYYQLKQVGKSLAVLKTLLNPVFNEQVSSEIYFLKGLNQLKTCDYLGVFKTIDKFKDASREPLATAEKRANLGDAQAKAELADYTETIAKMQLVEVEAIQHVYATEPGKRPTVSKITKNSDQLSFPESDEVWLDEIDSYQVQAKGCPVQGVM